jgi:cathepsin B
MEEIIKNGPVQVVFKVFEDFFMYKSGIYAKHPNAKVFNTQEPYHSVKLLGWGAENGVDYWVTKPKTKQFRIL